MGTRSLSKLAGIEFMWQEPLCRHTTFRIGGPVSCLARPCTEEALIELVRAVVKEGIPHFVLGGGSNVLGPDEPWNVVAIQLAPSCSTLVKSASLKSGAFEVYAGAGVRMAHWLRFCLESGFEGIESLVGIPGTVGGALVMNAGTAQGCIADVLVGIDVIDFEGRRRRIPRAELSPVYRSMRLPGDWIVLGGWFELRPLKDGSLKRRLGELMGLRKRSQPLGWPSAGCIFKNPNGVSAGALIDKSGLKGVRVGDAQISEKHANWIINRGKASARDVLALIGRMEEKVLENFGIRLEREIKVLG